MNIEKIVLDVLEKYKTVDKENFDADRFVFIRYKIDNCDFKDIAKSIVAKIQAVSIDRDEVEKILSILLITLHEIDSGVCEQITGKPMDDYVLNRTNAINGAITQICNLPIEEGDE